MSNAVLSTLRKLPWGSRFTYRRCGQSAKAYSPMLCTLFGINTFLIAVPWKQLPKICLISLDSCTFESLEQP